MSGPHLAPTANQLRQDLTAQADQLNGSANLTSTDRAFVGTLTEIYQASVEQNHREGVSGQSLKNQFNDIAGQLLIHIRDTAVRSSVTLDREDAQQLIQTTGRALDRALIP